MTLCRFKSSGFSVLTNKLTVTAQLTVV